MSAGIALKTDYTYDQLRRLARGSRNTKQVRRLLAMADILAGWSRSEVARRAIDHNSEYGRKSLNYSSEFEQQNVALSWSGQLHSTLAR